MLDSPDDFEFGYDRPGDKRPDVNEAIIWLDERSIAWEMCVSIIPGMLILEGALRNLY
jgi:hypothetical protein